METLPSAWVHANCKLAAQTQVETILLRQDMHAPHSVESQPWLHQQGPGIFRSSTWTSSSCSTADMRIDTQQVHTCFERQAGGQAGGMQNGGEAQARVAQAQRAGAFNRSPACPLA